MVPVPDQAGKPPFAGRIEPGVISSVFQNDRPPRPVHPECSDSLWVTINQCWASNPSSRMTIAEVIEILEAELDGSPATAHRPLPSNERNDRYLHPSPGTLESFREKMVDRGLTDRIAVALSASFRLPTVFPKLPWSRVIVTTF